MYKKYSIFPEIDDFLMYSLILFRHFFFYLDWHILRVILNLKCKFPKKQLKCKKVIVIYFFFKDKIA
jgi:hypothetical protein